jgi:hypothetical protein
MLRWLKLSSCPALVLFVLMGLSGAALAWNSVDLVHLSMANYRYIRQFGAYALMEGGLEQLVEIILRAAATLAFYLGFKACEVELVARWRSWKG